MAPHRIILDCDPGVDDAIAMLLAFASPKDIDIVGITTVAGNVPLPDTTRNALRIGALAGQTDLQVFAGCARPILPAGRDPGGVHGTDGLGDIGLPDASGQSQSQHAVDFIIDTVMASPGDITLCPIGPMTNVALALIKAPAIAQRIKQIVFMGGAAFCPGNSTPAAEFNLWFDPHAAEIVASAGIPLVMFGLDVTGQARLDADRLAAFRAEGGPIAKAAAGMMQAYGVGDPCLHDPCVIAWLIDPSLFSGVPARLSVESGAGLNCGRTVAAVSERHRKGQPATCHVMTEVDREGLFRLVTDRLLALDRAGPTGMASEDLAPSASSR